MGNKNKQPFCISEYCAIFVDLLGHKKFLKDLSNCARDEAQRRVSELSKPLLCFKEGALKRVEEVLGDTVKLIKEKSPESARPSLLSLIDDITYGVQQFSDSTLLYVKMGSPVSYIVVNMFLEFIVFRLLDNMSSGTPLRGGVAIGQGWELEDNCLCGQVIADAYDLESKVSNWGRVTVSELFESRLRSLCGLSEIVGGRWILEFLRPLTSIIKIDIDGAYFLDYLNPAVDEMYRRNRFNDKWFVDRIKSGLAFINDQCDRFKSESPKSLESARLALRYDIMRGYWNSRISMWASKEGVQL